jgi:hypothetical protein
MRDKVDQLCSIVAELNLPVSEESKTHNKVMEAWRMAVTTT